MRMFASTACAHLNSHILRNILIIYGSLKGIPHGKITSISAVLFVFPTRVFRPYNVKTKSCVPHSSYTHCIFSIVLGICVYMYTGQ